MNDWHVLLQVLVFLAVFFAGKTLRGHDGSRWGGDNAPLEALRRSLENLRTFWDRRAVVDWRREVVVGMVP